MGRNENDRPARFCDCCQGELWPNEWYYRTDDGHIYCEYCVELVRGDEHDD
jgi:hypothetical protein